MKEQKETTKVIAIKGMNCKSCEKLIEGNVGALKGINKIKVSFAEEKTHISYDSDVISLKAIKSEINKLGYKTGNESVKQSGFFQGIIYGLLPHTGCIAFIIFALLGITTATALLRPLLLNPYFFYILIALSMIFATISATIYLKTNDILSISGIKRKWRYLSILYGTTIFVNLLLFMVIFPYAANFTSKSNTLAFVSAATDSQSKLTLEVAIPCSGHAPLITEDLNKLEGVTGVNFRFPNLFDVSYDSGKISKQDILSLTVFSTYKAKVVEEQKNNRQSAQFSTSGGSCCGSGSCGASSGGGCGCGGS